MPCQPAPSMWMEGNPILSNPQTSICLIRRCGCSVLRQSRPAWKFGPNKEKRKMAMKLCGTDGIRAHAGEFPLNAAAVVAIGQAVGERLGGRILVGQDTRMSSPWILDLIQKGVSKTSAAIDDAGVIPTPAIALLTQQLNYSGGIMISASHNPYDDNGIKVFASDGTKLNDADEAAIERRVFELLPPGADTQVDAIPEQRISAENGTGWNEKYQEILLS